METEIKPKVLKTVTTLTNEYAKLLKYQKEKLDCVLNSQVFSTSKEKNYKKIVDDVLENIKDKSFSKTEVGIRPEFIEFNESGLPVKILKVSNTGRHKIIDTESKSGKIKVIAKSSTNIPTGSAFLNFKKDYTYVYGDNWIIE